MTRVLPVRDLKSGWTVVTARWDKVPDYPYQQTAKGLPDNVRRQELDLDWNASSGKLVYPEFGDIHVAKEPLPFDPERPLVLGWDVGGTAHTGTPACVLSQVSSVGQWLLYDCIIPPDDKQVSVYEFATEWVARTLYEEYAEPFGFDLEALKLVHFGDPAGNARHVTTLGGGKNLEKASCYEIIQNGYSVHKGFDERDREIVEKRDGLGWIIESGEVSVTRRLEAMKARLKLLINGGHPALVVDPEATYLLDAFRGGYCMTPDTPILYSDLKWRPIGQAKVGDELVAFDEYGTGSGFRKFRTSIIQAVWGSRKPTRRLVTEKSDIYTTDEHRWLNWSTAHGGWSSALHLRKGRAKLRNIGLPLENYEETEDYRVGYITGMTLGDGCFRYTPGQRSRPAPYWKVELKSDDHVVIGRLASYMASLGIPIYVRSNRRNLIIAEVRALESMAKIHRLLNSNLESLEYQRGWMAGFFDAEGSGSDSHLKVYQKDRGPLDRMVRYASNFGFDFEVVNREARTWDARLRGGYLERIRFFACVQPALHRKLNITGRQAIAIPDRLIASERGPVCDVVDIQTSTGTFYAGGLATHNCYPQRRDGRYELDPAKNHFSHGINAAEYSCSRLSSVNPDRFQEYEGYLPHQGAATWGHRKRD